MGLVIVIVVTIVLCIILWKSYCIKYDTVIAYTGGLGSGKSLESVSMSVKLLKKNRLKVKLHNLRPKNKDDKWPKPMLYSSIPVRIGRNEMSIQLTERHLLLEDKIIERSVVFIDEIGSFASQFEFKHVNLVSGAPFDEFIRLYRHYTKGGYIVVNDQCSENIVLTVRRRLNTVYNLLQFKKWFGLFYTVRIRNISISEEIKTIEEGNTEDNTRFKFGLIPFFKRYDTYCYSCRYSTVPFGDDAVYAQLKKYQLLRIPSKKAVPNTTDKEPETVEDDITSVEG